MKMLQLTNGDLESVLNGRLVSVEIIANSVAVKHYRLRSTWLDGFNDDAVYKGIDLLFIADLRDFPRNKQSPIDKIITDLLTTDNHEKGLLFCRFLTDALSKSLLLDKPIISLRDDVLPLGLQLYVSSL